MKYLVLILVVISLAIFAGIGWVMNLFALITSGFAEFTPELLIRLAGVPIVPVGIVAGWLL